MAKLFSTSSLSYDFSFLSKGKRVFANLFLTIIEYQEGSVFLLLMIVYT